MPENNYKKFTDEEIKLIENMSIIDYLKNQAFKLEKMSKNEYKIHGYGGLIISEAENCRYCLEHLRAAG